MPSFLFRQLYLLLLCLMGFNIAVSLLAANVVPRLLLKSIVSAEGPSVTILGNSLMAAGYSRNAFLKSLHRTNVKVLNLSLGATEPVDHLVVFRQSLGFHSPSHLIYGYYDHQLFHPISNDWRQFSGNRAVSLYIDPLYTAEILSPGSFLKKAQLFTVASVPAILERTLIWSKVELARRGLAGLHRSASVYNSFGRADDFQKLEYASEHLFSARSAEIVKAGASFSRPVSAMLSLAESNKIKITFVEMPMPASHRKRFYESTEWKMLRHHIQQSLKVMGAELIVASDWVGDESFADALHLGSTGAEAFSARLAMEMN